MLAASAKHVPAPVNSISVSLFILVGPQPATATAYLGQALRPIGFPLYRQVRRFVPIALKALRRRPFGRRSRSRAKPYASYLLRNEAPFVEQPIAMATAPELAKLRPQWLSSWSPSDLQQADQKLTLVSRVAKTRPSFILVHNGTLGPITGPSLWRPRLRLALPRPGVSPRRRGVRPQNLKV